MDRLTEKKTNRFRFLHALYEATDGDTHAILSMWKLGLSLGLDRESTSGVVDYLNGEHLLEYRALGGEIGITHYGVLEVERALSEPEKPTQYFPPVVNITHVHSMVNSQIQQGSHGSQQSFSISQNDMGAIGDFVRELGARLDTAGLAESLRAEVRAEVSSIEAQLASPKPKQSIIREGLLSIRTILEGAIGNVLATDMLPKLAPILVSMGGG